MLVIYYFLLFFKNRITLDIFKVIPPVVANTCPPPHTCLFTAGYAQGLRYIQQDINIDISIVPITRNYSFLFSVLAHKNRVCIEVILVIAQVLLGVVAASFF